MFFLKVLRYNSITEVATQQHSIKLPFSPLYLYIQRRWLKPVDSAQTRLENRTRDHRLDKLMVHVRKLKIILEIEKLVSCKKRGSFVSVQLMSRWKNIVGLNIGVGAFIRKYPHIFELFTNPYRRNLCCRITDKMRVLLDEEDNIIRECEVEGVKRIKKLLLMSKTGTLHVHSLRLIRRELGLPEDFRDSILAKYISEFRLVDLETVELIDADESLAVENVEQWREKEQREKWLSEFETKFAFPINFPTGFKIERGFREKVKNWQRLPYVKPYEKKDASKGRTRGGVERFEKRVVAIIHELLSVTVEKRVEVERLAHFKKDLGMEVNARELLLKHPGIFYISTKGVTQTVFLREAYSKGSLVEANPIYDVRKKMLDLVVLEQRHRRGMEAQDEGSEGIACEEEWEGRRDGEWVLPILANEADSFSK